jgi:hypothetical protein
MLTLLAPLLEPANRTELLKTPAGYELRRNGKPFFVKGAGAPKERLAELARYGANSGRTWGVGADSQAYLDEAQKRGIAVTIGFWMRRNDGFSYRDPKQLDEQAAEFRKWVRTYRSHPALLMWAVGNEVELGGEQPEIWLQTERLAKIAKEEDPGRPVMAVVADMWPEKMDALLKYCPTLDLLGVNSYTGLPTLRERMVRWTKPYLVTEFAFTQLTKNDSFPFVSFIEPGSRAKAASVESAYRKQILAEPGRILGSYFFYWSAASTGTSGLHSPFLSTGEALESVPTMARLWRGRAISNRWPVLRVDTKPREVGAGSWLGLAVSSRDPDGDAVTTRWELLSNEPSKRFVGDFEQKMSGFGRGMVAGGRLSVKLPIEKGEYRLLLVARDGRGAATTESVSLRVK